MTYVWCTVRVIKHANLAELLFSNDIIKVSVNVRWHAVCWKNVKEKSSYFFSPKMRQDVISQIFFFGLLSLFQYGVPQNQSECPSEQSKYHSVLVTLNSRDSLCVADLSLAASQELCFECDAGRGLPSAVGGWVSTASFNIQTLLISFDGSLKTRLQVRRCCDEWPVGGRKIYNHLLHIHWSFVFWKH